MLLMKRIESLPQAALQAEISCLIGAKTKKQALETAVKELNKECTQLASITMENEIGQSKDFTVLEVEHLDWFDVEHAECSHQYRVFGRIRLSISELKQTGYDIHDFEHTSFKIPPTFLYEKPVLVISLEQRHLFLSISQQVLEWNTFENAIPLSKLA